MDCKIAVSMIAYKPSTGEKVRRIRNSQVFSATSQVQGYCRLHETIFQPCPPLKKGHFMRIGHLTKMLVTEGWPFSKCEFMEYNPPLFCSFCFLKQDFLLVFFFCFIGFYFSF